MEIKDKFRFETYLRFGQVVRCLYVCEWSNCEGNGFTFSHSFEVCSVCHKSKLLCKFNHKSGVVSKARERRNAISVVMAPLLLIIFDNVFLETPRIDANSVMVIVNGFK